MATIIGLMKPHVDDIVEFHPNMNMVIHNKQFYPTIYDAFDDSIMQNDIMLILYF